MRICNLRGPYCTSTFNVDFSIISLVVHTIKKYYLYVKVEVSIVF